MSSLPTGFWVHFLTLSQEQKEAHAKEFGGYNDFPPNWKPMTEDEFSQSGFFTYVPSLVEHRQMFDRAKPHVPALSANLFYFSDGTGFAIANDFWNKCVLYFKFAKCEHKWGRVKDPDKERSLIIGSCMRAAQCEKCDFISVVDSSD